MVVGRRVGVVLGVRRLPQHRHVVIQGQDHVLRHDRVQQAEGEMRDGGVIVESNLPVEIEKEGDHLPGEVTAHLEHVSLDHSGIVNLGRVVLAYTYSTEYYYQLNLNYNWNDNNRKSPRRFPELLLFILSRVTISRKK